MNIQQAPPLTDLFNVPDLSCLVSQSPSLEYYSIPICIDPLAIPEPPHLIHPGWAIKTMTINNTTTSPCRHRPVLMFVLPHSIVVVVAAVAGCPPMYCPSPDHVHQHPPHPWHSSNRYCSSRFDWSPSHYYYWTTDSAFPEVSLQPLVTSCSPYTYPHTSSTTSTATRAYSSTIAYFIENYFGNLRTGLPSSSQRHRIPIYTDSRPASTFTPTHTDAPVLDLALGTSYVSRNRPGIEILANEFFSRDIQL